MGSVYAFSDLHGCWYNFEEILKILQPDDTIYCLGDCGDRGEDGWKIIKTVLDDPRFIYLKGNHEDMFCKAVMSYYRIKQTYNYIDEEEIIFHLEYDDDYSLMVYNGGEKTFKDWKKDKDKMFYYRKIKDLPIQKTYKNKKGQIIILTHAGYTPHLNQIPDDEDLIWNRYHFNQEWDKNFPDTIIVHGHTPIPYFNEYCWDYPKEEKEGALWYCNNHKVNIDCGTVFTGISTLVNLDTWNEYVIIDKKEWVT